MTREESFHFLVSVCLLEPCDMSSFSLPSSKALQKIVLLLTRPELVHYAQSYSIFFREKIQLKAQLVASTCSVVSLVSGVVGDAA